MASKHSRNDEELRTAWREAKATALMGAAKVLFPDNADPGRKAIDVVEILKSRGLRITYMHRDERLGTYVA